MPTRTRRRFANHPHIAIYQAWNTLDNWVEQRVMVGYDHYPKTTTVKVGSIFAIHTSLNYRSVEPEWRIADPTVAASNPDGTFVALKPGSTSLYSKYSPPGLNIVFSPPYTALADVIVTP